MCMGIVSVFYFLSLMVQAHVVITAVVALGACISLHRWLFRPVAGHETTYLRGFPLLVLITAIAILSIDAAKAAQRYGQWDAWAMWNLAAKYLSAPSQWQDMFLNTKFNHPDYPLFLPSSVAFFSKLLTGGYSHLVSFAFSLLACISIPVLLFTETYKKIRRYSLRFFFYTSPTTTIMWRKAWHSMPIHGLVSFCWRQ